MGTQTSDNRTEKQNMTEKPATRACKMKMEKETMDKKTIQATSTSIKQNMEKIKDMKKNLKQMKKEKTENTAPMDQNEKEKENMKENMAKKKILSNDHTGKKKGKEAKKIRRRERPRKGQGQKVQAYTWSMFMYGITFSLTMHK